MPPFPIDGSEHGARLAAGGNDGLALLMVRLQHAQRNPIAVKPAQAELAMKDRQAPSGIDAPSPSP